MLETSKIELHGDISIPFLKKSRFTGSFKGTVSYTHLTLPTIA